MIIFNKKILTKNITFHSFQLFFCSSSHYFQEFNFFLLVVNLFYNHVYIFTNTKNVRCYLFSNIVAYKFIKNINNLLAISQNMYKSIWEERNQACI